MRSEGTGLPKAFLTAGSSSFLDFVRTVAPELLPDARSLPAGSIIEAAHGTTIVAAQFLGGVVMAGDRRATMGSMIANREIEKVFSADNFSMIGVAGTAGLAIELVRMFQLELEHYEKIEGTSLSLEGKANRLATMLRANLGLAMQGLPITALFAGFDPNRGVSRIFSYDVTGGRYEETSHHCIGSGSVFARGALKKLWRPEMECRAAVAACIEALWDAADDDSATGGPDSVRAIWPIVAVVTQAGFEFIPEAELATISTEIIAQRTGSLSQIRSLTPGTDGPGNTVPVTPLLADGSSHRIVEESDDTTTDLDGGQQT